jgi:hypothetical protein
VTLSAAYLSEEAVAELSAPVDIQSDPEDAMSTKVLSGAAKAAAGFTVAHIWLCTGVFGSADVVHDNAYAQ